MEPVALVLVLASAALHASWNLAVKASRDRLIAAWAQVTFGAIVFLPILLATGVPTAVLPAIVCSGLVHLGYGLALVAAYDRGDLSFVYPVARGVAPVLVTCFAALLLDDVPGAWGLVAVAAIAAGVLWTGAGSGREGLGWALATGGLIATYTLLDGAAVRTLDGSLAYTTSVFAMNGLAYLPVVLIRRRPALIVRSMRAEGWKHLLAGSASALAYVLVLAAARLAPLGVVAALRETSVLFGVVAGWAVLGEPSAPRRLRGAGLIAAGLIVLVVVR
jgi:drug/metabolite transporter (DMT)-like permease